MYGSDSPFKELIMKQSRSVLESKRYGVYTCHADAALLDASRQMVDEDVSCLVVITTDGYLAGIVTRFDLMRACLHHDGWDRLPVSAVMTRDVVTVSPETTLYEVAQLLDSKGIHRVVAVREENGRLRPISVVSASDLVYHMVHDL
jgi:CBS domain-containing protein